MTRIELLGGKYTVIHDQGTGLRAERYGEPWRDLTGDGLVLAMAHEIEALRAQVSEDPIDPDKDNCNHDWVHTGAAYGGDDESFRGYGRVYCAHCGADGDA